jgi:hypothetical protein
MFFGLFLTCDLAANTLTRLIVFSVDAAEGKTVTFDSYPKVTGLRNSEYGKYSTQKTTVFRYRLRITYFYARSF